MKSFCMIWLDKKNMYTGILLLSCLVLVELVGYYLLHDMAKGRGLDWCYHQG